MDTSLGPGFVLMTGHPQVWQKWRTDVISAAHVIRKILSTRHCNKQLNELGLPPPFFTLCVSSLLVGLTSQASPTSRPCSGSQAACWLQLGCFCGRLLA